MGGNDGEKGEKGRRVERVENGEETYSKLVLWLRWLTLSSGGVVPGTAFLVSGLFFLCVLLFFSFSFFLSL